MCVCACNVCVYEERVDDNATEIDNMHTQTNVRVCLSVCVYMCARVSECVCVCVFTVNVCVLAHSRACVCSPVWTQTTRTTQNIPDVVRTNRLHQSPVGICECVVCVCVCV